MKGFTPALRLVAYIALFVFVLTNGGKVFPNIKETYAPLLFLTAFSFSVLTCMLIVFYKPYMLFIDKKQKEAGQLVLSTAKWLGVMVAIVMVFVAMMSR